MKWRVGDSFQKAYIESFSSIFFSVSHNSQNEVENGISRMFAFLCPRTQSIIEFGIGDFKFSVRCSISCSEMHVVLQC